MGSRKNLENDAKLRGSESNLPKYESNQSPRFQYSWERGAVVFLYCVETAKQSYFSCAPSWPGINNPRLLASVEAVEESKERGSWNCRNCKEDRWIQT